MNILIRELKSNSRSLIIWCASMVFLIYAGMIKYSAFAETGDAVNEFMASIPIEMRSILGIGNGADLTSVAVFYSIFFIYFLLLASVHSAMLGALIVSKEERDKTSDFLFVKPIKRSYAISYKIVAALINILVFDIVTFLASVLSVEKYRTGESLTYPIFLIVIALFVIQILFLGIGLLLGAVSKNSKKAASLASFLILGTFVFKVIIDLNKDIEFLDFLSPFKYFDANIVMFDKQIDLYYTLLSFALAIICVISTHFFFNKRDLKS